MFTYDASGNYSQRLNAVFIIFCIFLVIMSKFRDLSAVFKVSAVLECLVYSVKIMLWHVYMHLTKTIHLYKFILGWSMIYSIMTPDPFQTLLLFKTSLGRTPTSWILFWYFSSVWASLSLLLNCQMHGMFLLHSCYHSK